MDLSYHPISRQEQWRNDSTRNDEISKGEYLVYERAKASATYGVFETINYWLILPIKEMMDIKLNAKEARNLDLYRKHTDLCSGIEKVQNAYKSYIAAQEAADQSPTNSADARLHAMAEGNSLVNNYTSLMKLAFAHAEKCGDFNHSYLEDLKRVMGDTDFEIFVVVNSIRLKAVEAKWLNGSNDNAKEAYLKFVTEYVSNVREANLQLVPDHESLYQPLAHLYPAGRRARA
jgi:hypothetical protein